MANQIVVSAGAKVRNLDGVLTATSGVVSSLPIDGSLGIPQLDVNGKILVSQLPNSVMEYKGTWSAATNIPTLANGTGNQGDVYLCNVAGTVDFGAGPIVFFVGDQVIYSGSIWQRASGATGTVTSVAVTESGDSLNITGSPITTSGTINIGFNGTNLQYVNGAGNLTTFPDLTGFVPYTGATTNVVLGTNSLKGNSLYVEGDSSFTSGGLFIKQYASGVTNVIGYNVITTQTSGYLFSVSVGASFKNFILDATSLTDVTQRTYTLPNASGTLALTSSLSSYVPYTGATADVNLGLFDLYTSKLWLNDIPNSGYGSLELTDGVLHFEDADGHSMVTMEDGYLTIANASTIRALLNVSGLSANRDYAFPNASGTIALTSDLANYVDLTTAQTIGGTKTFTNATKNNGGILLQNASSSSLAGYMNLGGLTNGVKFTSGGGVSNTFTLPSATGYTFTFDAITGTLAMLEGTQTFSGAKTFTSFTKNDFGVLLNASGNYTAASGYNGFGGISNGIRVVIGQTAIHDLVFSAIANYTYTFPASTGTIALTSDISYPVTSVFGRTGAVVATSGDYTTTQVTEGTNLYYTDVRARASNSFVAGSGAYNSTTGVITIPTNNNQITNGAGYITLSSLSATSPIFYNSTTGVISSQAASATLEGYITTGTQTFAGLKTFNDAITANSGVAFLNGVMPPITSSYYSGIGGNSTGISIVYRTGGGTNYTNNLNFPASNNSYSFPSSGGTLALTTDLGAYLPLTGGTLTGNLSIAYTTANLRLFLNNTTATTGRSWYFNSYSNGNLYVGNTTAGDIFNFSSTGAATFSNNITLNSSTSMTQTKLNILATLGVGTYGSPMIGMFDGTSSPNGFDFGLETLSTGNFFLNRVVANVRYSVLEVNRSTGAATFSSSVSADIFTASGSSAIININSNNGNANSRNWRFVPLVVDYGDLYLQVSTTQGGTPSTNVLGFSRTGAATFSSSVTAGGAINAGGDITANDTSVGSTFLYLKGDATTGVAGVRFARASTGSQMGKIDYDFGTDKMIFRAGGNDRMYLTSGGNILIGTTTDGGAKLQVAGQFNATVNGSSNIASFNNGSGGYGVAITAGTGNQWNLYVTDYAGTPNFYVTASGYGYLLGSAWAYGSDLRMKENISDVENGLNMVLKMKPKHFDYINGIKNNLGFIAQDIQEIIPQAVSVSDEVTGMLALKSDFIVPYLVKAIQELKAEIDTLKNK